MTTDNTLPAPLVPAEVDLRGLEYMPLLGAKLFSSDFDLEATDAEFRRALKLWWAAWNQQPAGSLPNSDRSLAKLAGFEDEKSPSWRKVRERALHGFILCSDNRLYHPVLAPQALIAWEKRGEVREVRENEAARKARERDDRKRMFAELRALGVVPSWKTSTGDLRQLYAQHVTPKPVTPVTPTGHDDKSPPVTVTGTAKNGIDGNGIEREEGSAQSVRESPARAPAPPVKPEPTPAGRIGLALRRGGLQPGQFQTSDPRVVALAEAGYTDEEVEAVAREATEKRKRFPWVVATLHGRRADARAITAGPAAAPPPDWRTDRHEVIRRGCELGIGPYQNLDHTTGRAITFDAYRRRVIEADDNARNTAGSPA